MARSGDGLARGVLVMALALAACGKSGGEPSAAGAAATPAANASAAPTAAASGQGDGTGDAKVAGTPYSATAEVPCTGVGAAAGTCPAGVTRSPEQIAIEITLPKGGMRVLLFDGKGKFVTVSTAEADGSAAYRISMTREDDWTVIKAGPEGYRIPDAFVLGD